MSNKTILPESNPTTTIAILRAFLTCGRPNLSGCTKEFIKLPYFTNFLKGRKAREISKFAAHLKKYVAIFLPDAGFEITSTSRYTGQAEACIIATKDWKKGEYITNCSGTICTLSDDVDRKLRSENRDSSIMISQRKRGSYLFLGPARFINHDCLANCDFVKQGSNVTFRAIKNIESGQELTVSYGQHYFGIDNCECRCVTCEEFEKGFYSKTKTIEKDKIKLAESSRLRRSLRNGKQINSCSKKDRKSSKIYSPYKCKNISLSRSKDPIYSSFIASTAYKNSSSFTSTGPSYTSIKTTMSLKNICNSTNYTPRLSTIELQCKYITEEKFEQILQAYPENINIQSISSKFDQVIAPNNVVSLLHNDLHSAEKFLGDQEILSQWEPLTCCSNANEYTRSDKNEMCARCFRHLQIFGLAWPKRRE